MAYFDIDRLGLDEGEELLPGIVLQADGGMTGQFRVLCDGQHGEGATRKRKRSSMRSPPRRSSLRPTRPGAEPPRRQAAAVGRVPDDRRQDAGALGDPAAQPGNRRAPQAVTCRRRAEPRRRSRRARGGVRPRCRAASRSRARPGPARARRAEPLGSIAAPSACATAVGLRDAAPSSALRHRGSLRMKPSGGSAALVVHASAHRRTSFDHRTSASLSPTRVGTFAPSSRVASRSTGWRRSVEVGGQIDPDCRDCSARPSGLRAGPPRSGSRRRRRVQRRTARAGAACARHR